MKSPTATHAPSTEASEPCAQGGEGCVRAGMEQQVEFVGTGSLSFLRPALDRMRVRSVFTVTGKASYRASGAEAALQPVLASRQVLRYFDFQENPQASDLARAIPVFAASGADCILAVGGGSVIDMAKLIRHFAGDARWSDTAALTAFVEDGGRWAAPAATPLVAVPTTSGSGSQATSSAVLYCGRRKYSIEDRTILPDICCVDPLLTASSPARVTAATGMDALCHAVESYWSIRSSAESQRYSSETIVRVLNALREAVFRPSPRARLLMSEAAHYAGKAINLTRTTASHALSYALTSYFGVKHGHAAALTLGKMLEYNAEVTDADVADPRGAAHVKRAIDDLCRLLGVGTPREAASTVADLMRDIGLETRLGELGIRSESDLALITGQVNAARLSNNPRTLTTGQLNAILHDLR